MVGVSHQLSGAEIKVLYEAIANAFTDTKNTKLTGIETAAKDDQTGAQIKTLLANLLTHGESVNRLKYIQMGVGHTNGGTPGIVGKYTCVVIDLAGEEVGTNNLFVPTDFVSFSKVYIAYERITAEPVITIEGCYAASDQPESTHTDANNVTCNQANTNGDIGIMDTGLTLASLAAGDYLGIKAVFHTNSFYFLSFIFEYTADA